MTQSELLQSQTSAGKQVNSNSNSKLFEREQIPNTPFWIIGNDEKGFWATMGKYQITKGHKTKEEVKLYLEEHLWDVILTMCLVIYNDVKDHPINAAQ